MPGSADRTPTSDCLGVKVEDLHSYSRTLASLIDSPITPSLAAMSGRMLALSGAAAPVVINWGSPDWLEMTHRVWSQGGVPGG